MTTPLQRECLIIVLTSILLGFILVRCSSNGANNQGELFIKVLDAPASFQQVNIVVDHVSIHRTGASAEVGWTIAGTNSFYPCAEYSALRLDSGFCCET
jgi:hypothetical protein